MPTVIGFMACVGLAQDPGPLCDPWEPLSGTPPNRPDPSLHAPAPPPPLPDHTIGGGVGDARRLTIYVFVILFTHVHMHIY